MMDSRPARSRNSSDRPGMSSAGSWLHRPAVGPCVSSSPLSAVRTRRIARGGRVVGRSLTPRLCIRPLNRTTLAVTSNTGSTTPSSMKTGQPCNPAAGPKSPSAGRIGIGAVGSRVVNRRSAAVLRPEGVLLGPAGRDRSGSACVRKGTERRCSTGSTSAGTQGHLLPPRGRAPGQGAGSRSAIALHGPFQARSRRWKDGIRASESSPRLPTATCSHSFRSEHFAAPPDAVPAPALRDGTVGSSESTLLHILVGPDLPTGAGEAFMDSVALSDLKR